MEFKKVIIPTEVKMKEGDEFAGKFDRMEEATIFDRGTATKKVVNKYFFFDIKDGMEKTMLGNTGLNRIMSDASIKSGEVIKLVKLAKEDIGNSKTRNRYEIYRA